MTDQAGRVAVACPSCSPGLATPHEILSPQGSLYTVRCTECGHVHKEQPPDDTTVEREVVVSQDDESFAASVEVPPDETVAVGEEFVLDTDEAIMAVRITALEVGPEQRTEEAQAADVETFWTRAVDNVYVNITIHPADGQHDATRSVKVGVPGDYEFTIGESDTLGEEEFTVEGLLLRDGAVGYPAEKLDHAGDTAEAKDIKRVLARSDASTAWSAW